MTGRAILPLVLATALALTACGSSGSSVSSRTTPNTQNPFENASWDKAGPTPSISAKMICQKEARVDIAASLGLKETSATPKWVERDHVYSCAYAYPHGKILLSVKELSNGTETTAYFERVQRKYGRKQQLTGVGQGGWILKNDDIVARKDYKVLFVDVQGIPSDFVPAMSASDVAQSVAVVIMGCWTGA